VLFRSPRAIVNTQLDWYTSTHISIDNISIKTFLFNDNLSFADLNNAIFKQPEIFENIEVVNLDKKTQDILNIAAGLKGVKIQRIEEEYIPEEEIESPIVASETMAKILVKQQKISQAIEVYNMLIAEKPIKKKYFQTQIDILSKNTFS
jgi:hypothetical protein